MGSRLDDEEQIEWCRQWAEEQERKRICSCNKQTGQTGKRSGSYCKEQAKCWKVYKDHAAAGIL